MLNSTLSHLDFVPSVLFRCLFAFACVTLQFSVHSTPAFADFNGYHISSVSSTHFLADANSDATTAAVAAASTGAFATLATGAPAPLYRDGVTWEMLASSLPTVANHNNVKSGAESFSSASATSSWFFPRAASSSRIFSPSAAADLYHARLASDPWGGWSVTSLSAPTLPSWEHPAAGVLTLALTPTTTVEVYYSRNEALFAPSYTEQRQVWIDGKRITELETAAKTRDEVVHCYYHGKVVAATTHSAVNGADGSGMDTAAVHLAAAAPRFTVAEAAATPAVADTFVALDTCTGGFAGVLGFNGTEYGVRPAVNVLSQRDVAFALASVANGRGEALSPGALHVVFDLAAQAAAADEAAGIAPGGKRCGVAHDAIEADLEDDEDEDEHDQARAEAKSARVRRHQHRHHNRHHGHGSFAETRRTIEAKLRAAGVDMMSPDLAAADSAAAGASVSANVKMATKAVPSIIYVELMLASDNLRYNRLLEQTEYDSATIANTMAAIYASTTTFSTTVEIVLVAQVAFVVQDPWTVAVGTCSTCATGEVSVDELLAKWNSWRSNTAVAPTHDNGHLLSGHDFEQTVLGYAGVAVQCVNAYAGGINQARASHTTEFVATVVTHELGHNFAMMHDSQGNTCAASGFVMNAVVGILPPKIFSTCSVTYFNAYVDSSLTCLLNKPTTKWGEDPICGNGFVEAGEVCDCGQADCTGVDNCCNGSTCQLKSTAACSSRDACCTSSCQLRSASENFICRAATSSCDLAEVCDGVSASCPTDLVIGAGHECSVAGGSTGNCYAGACMSHAQACAAAGASFSGAPYTACASQSKLNNGNFCGTMFCSSTRSSSDSCTYFSSAGSARIMDTGVPCGDGQQCFNGECMSSNSLSTAFVWRPESWNNCSACGTVQSRDVTCVNSADSAEVREGLERLCPPETAMPDLQRPCENATLACVYAEELDGDVRFFTIRIGGEIVAFVSIGIVLVFALAVALAYRAVTKPVDGVKNMHDRETMRKPA